MLKDRRLTLIIIPEEGGQTFEFKLARVAVWVAGVLAVGVVLFLIVGLWALFKARQLDQRVVRLGEENTLLQEEVAQIQQFEQVLEQLQRSNHQLRTILGERSSLDAGFGQPRSGSSHEQLVSSTERLRWGRVHSVPSLWPLEGALARTFSGDFPAVLIAAPLHSLVRASAAGRVVQADFDEQLGYQVVIDHGGGLLSKYGYNATLLVAAGQDVNSGQPIALSGRSGRAPMPGLYYAVLEGGTARDPQRYRMWL